MRSILASLALGLLLGLLLATAWLAPRAAGAQPPAKTDLEKIAEIAGRIRQNERLLAQSETARLAGDCAGSRRLRSEAENITIGLYGRQLIGHPVELEAVEDLMRRGAELGSRDCPPINTAQRAQQVIQQALTEARNARAGGDCYVARLARDRARAIVEEPATSALFTAPLLQQWKAEIRAEDAFSCANAAPQTAIPCPSTFPQGVTSLNCRCSTGIDIRGVWGSFYYAEESGLCAAAHHAGAIRVQGGPILARAQAGRNYYVGSNRYGIASRRMSSSNRTIIFAGVYNPREERLGQFRLCQFHFSVYPAAERQSGVTCRCMPGILGYEGTVYGSGPYAADSQLCAAARHAGALSSEDGLITVTALPGQNGYRASTQNGITSRYWGYYPVSMSIVAASD